MRDRVSIAYDVPDEDMHDIKWQLQQSYINYVTYSTAAYAFGQI